MPDQGTPESLTLDASRYADLDEHDLAEWRTLSRLVHPPEEARLGADLRWAELDPLTDECVRLWLGAELVACAWVTRRDVLVDGSAMIVAGIRGVMTHPAKRRRGLGRAVMVRAHEVIDRYGALPFALLFSSVMAVPFYESVGWRTFRGRVLCDQPEGRIEYAARLPGAPVMIRVAASAAPTPIREVDVLGLPW